MLSLNYEETERLINTFIWDFKDGDNILYNFQILFLLFQNKNDAPIELKKFYNKPISIIAVSIAEAIFFDFIERLNLGTRHFPRRLLHHKVEIKRRIQSEKTKSKKTGHFRVKNYSMPEMVKIFEEFEVLGAKKDPIYSSLTYAAYFRNRVHISNYYGSFEKDEEDVFNLSRTKEVLHLLENIISIMSTLYPRPW